MNIEQLEKGKVLKNKIELLEKRLERWSKAVAITSVNLTVPGSSSLETVNVDHNYINLGVLKTLTIDSITEELKKTRLEFENL